MIKRRKFTAIVLAAAVGVMGLSFAASPAGAEVTLKLAHFGAESHPSHTAAKQLAARVAERTGGAVMIDIFPANQLGSPPEQLEQTLVGAVNMNRRPKGRSTNT